ncbi:hypothetical protein BJP40_15570 [Streptomyces sp. CC53]|nr:hypothetical protein BJP40_15570 [Streptomyces sp. CC53]
MDHAGLHGRLRPYGLDGVGQAAEAVADEHEGVARAAVWGLERARVERRLAPHGPARPVLLPEWLEERQGRTGGSRGTSRWWRVGIMGCRRIMLS